MRRIGAGIVLAALVVSLGGCFNPFSPRIATGVGISEPKPAPLTPVGVIQLFQWCYRNRALAEYKELFTDDYVFTFSALDPEGNPYREHPYRREEELASAEHLFVTGNATEEAASSITLDFTNTLVAVPDTRPGKRDRWHRQLNVGVVLVVRRPSSQLEVKGEARFFVVRGDTAIIPPELGLRRDSTRWYIEGWEDYTVQNSPGAARLLPAGAVTRAPRAVRPATVTSDPFDVIDVTFGALKALYR